MSLSDLHTLLGDVEQAGAYFIDSDDRATLVEAAALHGFALHPIDLLHCRDKQDALRRIAQALRFPEWFGENWDALADCLNDLSWLEPVSGRLLVFDHAGEWQRAQPEDFATLLEICSDAAESWMPDDVALWTLIPLPAAELPDGGGLH